ncbi:MAG TPA: alanine--tRNA ligase [Actinomycetota bacterium]|nr:alanine--tRNA ligase [Actinomycetota bacterium]
MDSRTIRDRFVAFFERRDHRLVASSSLVPNDPTLLLTNAGMNQFKPYFLGEQSAPFARATSVQKCFRTTDIDEVGRTARHLTFFEMLGNFSFGDYYKEKACPWAWELVTEVWGFDPELLWVTVYETDDEAAEVWADGVGVRPERILRRGKKDNFWSMGVAGPCGPCSEIFVDLGDAYGDASERGPDGNEDRYLEIWNLVFMQDECDAAIEPIAPLPRRNIDTGAGLERVALALQGAASVYETDTLGAMVAAAEDLTGVRYGSGGRSDMGLRVLADHGRALTFLIADGVLPSNEERGYVLRRVMRRAVRHARLLGRDDPVLPALVEATVSLMGDAYPELRARRAFVVEVAAREEERFSATLRQGLALLERELEGARSSGGATLGGDVAFRLHDTFGFPVDLTTEIAGEAGVTVETDAFERLMSAQRERARAARASGSDARADALERLAAAPAVDALGATEFVGYEHLGAEGSVVAMLGDGPGDVASEGAELWIVLDRTPFYAEGGGQVADRGTIAAPSGRADVLDVRRVAHGVSAHRVAVRAGEIALGDAVRATVDGRWRRGAERAHTATHILHWALRDRLGEHARQAGSLVEPGRLRFDFSHYEPLGDERAAEIGDAIQSLVLHDDGVRAYETSYDFARSIGAMAIFGEKYGDFVRVVEVGDYSKELCGGTHVAHTSAIGVVVLTAEGSVGANVRRVEALVGDDGLAYLRRRIGVLERSAEVLKVPPDDVAERVERLVAQHKDMERRLAEVERRAADDEARALAESAVDVDGTRLVVARRDVGVDALRSLAQTLKGRLGSAVVVLGSAGSGRANLVGAVTKDVAARGVSARDVLAPGASVLGGGAGGKPELAVSGGPQADRLDEAMEVAARTARELLER